jgi:hypothetical protein
VFLDVARVLLALLRPARPARTILGGVLLAALALAVLALLGVPAAKPRSRLTEEARPVPGTAHQPALEQLLLGNGDLPKGYVGGAVNPVPSPTRTAAASDPATMHPAAGRPESATADQCRFLLANPSGALVGPTGAAQAVQSDHRQPADGATMRQAIASFRGGGAAVAFNALHALLGGCGPFGTPDGMTATLREVQIPTVGDGSYAFLLTLRAGRLGYDGYLAVERVGTGLTLLRYLQPTGRPADPMSPPAIASMLRSACVKLRTPR